MSERGWGREGASFVTGRPAGDGSWDVQGVLRGERGLGCHSAQPGGAVAPEGTVPLWKQGALVPDSTPQRVPSHLLSPSPAPAWLRAALLPGVSSQFGIRAPGGVLWHQPICGDAGSGPAAASFGLQSPRGVLSSCLGVQDAAGMLRGDARMPTPAPRAQEKRTQGWEWGDVAGGEGAHPIPVP